MKFDFMGNRFKAFAFSGTLVCLALLIMLFVGFRYGIDFQGGSIMQVRFVQPATESSIREAFDKMKSLNLWFKSEQLIIQQISEGQGRDFIIQYPSAPREDAETARQHGEIQKALKATLPYSDDAISIANVGPTVGAEMKKQAVVAAFLSIVGILLYLAWRFEWQSATGAVLALLHDLIIVLGVVALIKLEFDVQVLAAILTMLGFSVNDSIVVLDRIRENRRLMRNSDLPTIINDSINQTLGRTINTSLTVLMTLLSLLIFGGTSIHGFSLTFFVGVFVGTYSSVFIASPVLLHMGGPAKGEKRKHAVA